VKGSFRFPISPGVFINDTSIVAVHGLGANPDKTWNYNSVVGTNASQTSSSSDVNLNNASSTMWLKDLLPQHVPKARIMAFNYASESLRNAPRESMRPLANRLLANIDDSRQALEVTIDTSLAIDQRLIILYR